MCCQSKAVYHNTHLFYFHIQERSGSHSDSQSLGKHGMNKNK